MGTARQGHIRLRPAFAVMCLLLSACSWLAPKPAPLAPPPPATPESLQLQQRRQLSPRLEQLTFTTPALDGPTHVNVLLPAQYAAEPDRHYPVLYLLQGAIDDYTAWIAEGNAEALTAGYAYIVVMPDAGDEGYYSDSFNGGAGGPPQWETYHVSQLLPWIDAHYRTIPERGQRAIAGVSMGGFGALSYAARHPDLFGAAISFSGLIDTRTISDRISIPNSVFGPPGEQDIRWRGHNPWDLAGNLHGVAVSLYTRNGWPGAHWLKLDPAEIIVRWQNLAVHRRLQQLGVPHQWHDQGHGPHKWPIWQYDLVDALAALKTAFAHPLPPPSPLDFTAIEQDYAVFGWQVHLQRPVLEFSTLSDAGAQGFSLSGSGSAEVTTPPLYPPGTTVMATLRNAQGELRLPLLADAAGRLEVPVPLGPANPAQAGTAAADEAGGNRVYTTSVRFAPPAPVSRP